MSESASITPPVNQGRASYGYCVKQAGLRLEVAAAACNDLLAGLSPATVDSAAMLAEVEERKWMLEAARTDFHNAIKASTEMDASQLLRWMVL